MRVLVLLVCSFVFAFVGIYNFVRYFAMNYSASLISISQMSVLVAYDSVLSVFRDYTYVGSLY